MHKPRDLEAGFLLAEILRLEEKAPEAIEWYKKILAATPDHLPALQALAWSYFELHQYEAAQRTAQEAREIAPDDLHSALILAQIWIQQHQEKKALALLNSFSEKKLPPEAHALWLSTRGKAQLSLEENLPAYHSFRAALAKSPLLASALLGIGETYVRFGQKKEAQEYLEQALHVNPRLTKGYYLLGTLLQKSDPVQAKKYLEIFEKRQGK
jgi:tetratricopeptide (TPR) repeat protein